MPAIDCTIHPYRDADAPDLHEAIQESVAEVGRWLPWCRPEYSLEEARQWVAMQQDLTRQGLEYDFAVRSASGRYLGGCGLNQINKVNRFANLGYWIRTSAMGQGIAPAAARRVIQFAFAHTDLGRLEIVCAVGNLRSQKVAEKVGGFREGVLRNRLLASNGPTDAVMFSVIRP